MNDVQGVLAAFWQVMRSPDLFDRFERYMLSTPVSAQEFRKQKEILSAVTLDEDDEDPELLLEAAIAFYIVNRQSRQGLGKEYVVPSTRTRRRRNETVSAWCSAVENLPWFHDRMLRVEVNRLDFRDYLAKYDHERALFFCDPPYLHSTRVAKQAYGEAEMSDDDHQDLLKILGKIRGRFMLCGYDSDLYSYYAIEHKWRVVSKTVSCPSSSKKAKGQREEFLWMNY